MGERDQRDGSASFFDAFSVVGFALCWGAYFGSFLGSLLFAAHTGFDVREAGALIARQCGFVIALLVFWRAADLFEDPHRAMLPVVVCGACTVVGGTLMAISSNALVAIGADVVWGAALGILSHTWATTFSGGSSRAPMLVVLSMAVGAVLLLLMGAIVSKYGTYLAVGYAVASLAMLAFSRLRDPARTYRSKEDSRKEFSLTARTACVICLYGVVLGFVVYCVYSYSRELVVSSPLFAGGLFAGCALWMLLHVKYRSYVPFGVTERIVLPVVIASLIFPMVVSGGVFRAAFFSIAFAVLVFFASNSLTVQIMMVQSFKLSSNYHLSRGRLPIHVGILVGWCLAVACDAALRSFAFGGESAFLPVLCVLAIMLNVVVACIPFEQSDRLVDELRGRDLAGEGSEGDSSLDFDGACSVLAERCGLSPRELDVLLLLARGRGISAIAEKLVVSQSTVKTHVAHIYRKAGVNSREQLIDAVDAVMAEERER